LLRHTDHTEEVTVKDPNELAGRYVALWNEPDPARRRAGVAQVFAEDSAHLLHPPQEAREVKAAPVVNPIFEARGHADLEARVTGADEEWVETGGFSFRPQDGRVRLDYQFIEP
jgi:hypothetical protein